MSNKITYQRSQASASLHEMAPAIEMIDLCKTFGTLRAVDHLSLSVKPGEIFGLLGPNGSGKTTTIDMLSGLSIPTSGEVRVMGYDVRRQARAVQLGRYVLVLSLSAALALLLEVLSMRRRIAS